jgi:hypothetical protein
MYDGKSATGLSLPSRLNVCPAILEPSFEEGESAGIQNGASQIPHNFLLGSSVRYVERFGRTLVLTAIVNQ